MKGLLKLIFGFGVPSWLVYALAALVIAGAVYAKGRIDAGHIAEVTALKLELEQERAANKQLADYIARLEKAAAEDAEQAAEDAAEIAALKTKIKELSDGLQDPDHICFTESDVDRLRLIWERRKNRGGNGQGGAGPR